MLDWLGGAPSAAVGVICLVLAGVLIIVGKMTWPRLAVALVLTGTTGLVNGTIGAPLHRGATAVDGWIGSAVGRLTGTAVTGLLALAVIASVAFWIWRKRINNTTLAATAVVPVVSSLVPGTAGLIIMTAVGAVPAILGGLVSWLFFGAW